MYFYYPMTHIIGIYDGTIGKLDRLETFLKWINSLSYDVDNGVGGKTYHNVEPRIMIPINFRVAREVKERFLQDLKTFENPELRKTIDKAKFLGVDPIKISGMKRIDMNKIKHSFKHKQHIGYLTVIGEKEDKIFPKGHSAEGKEQF